MNRYSQDTNEESSVNDESNDDSTLNEDETEDGRLLPSRGWSEERKKDWDPTPLPWSQLSIVLLNWVCGALAGQSMQPYVNQRVGELDVIGGDKRRVGYYVGLIDSFSQITLTVTILQWNRLSDYTGRKPVLLTGIFGLMVSQICFGLSQTYVGLVASACLWGLLDSNVGIAKSVVGEITDSTNRATGFVSMNVSWAIGATLGPLIGGLLARPSDRFPTLFGGEFWKRYPYFLPSFTVSIIVAASFVLTLVRFKETLVKPSEFSRGHSEESSSIPPDDKPLPLLQVFTYRVVVAFSNYMSLAFLSACFSSLFPLFSAMPVEIGGLGFDPPRIGYIMGAYSAITGIFAVVAFPRLVHRFGVRRIFITAMSSFPVVWIIFPMISLSARYFGIGVLVWIWIALLLLPTILIDMAYSCTYIFVTSAAPNKRSLGTTNGISQTSASIARIIAPAFATSLFSFCAEHNILGGYAVYVVLFLLSGFGILLALRLPTEMRPAWEEEGSDIRLTRVAYVPLQSEPADTLKDGTVEYSAS